MAKPEHLALLRSGKDAFNAWRDECPDMQVDLSGADLSGMHLRGYNLSEANLQGANLRWARLQGVDLRAAELRGVKLWRARLPWANLFGAKLDFAYLKGTILFGANLQKASFDYAALKNANLNQTNCAGATFWWASFSNTDLRGSNLILGAPDEGGQQPFLTYDKGSGDLNICYDKCSWLCFDDAREYFANSYVGRADRGECLLILDQLEARYRLRMKREANQRPLATGHPAPTTDNNETHP